MNEEWLRVFQLCATVLLVVIHTFVGTMLFLNDSLFLVWHSLSGLFWWLGSRFEETHEEAQCPKTLDVGQARWCFCELIICPFLFFLFKMVPPPPFLKGSKAQFMHLHVLIQVLFICCMQAPKPSSGPHKSRECLPLILIIRNRLKYALTYREVISILMQRHVLVDGKVRTDKTYPAGFMGMWPFETFPLIEKYTETPILKLFSSPVWIVEFFARCCVNAQDKWEFPSALWH